jgi:hypothetical protein
MDGQPLPNARVAFQPSVGGRGSVGITDAEGRYTLHYAAGREGALLGSHTVYITPARPGGDSLEKGKKKVRPQPAVPIPAAYNEQTTLTAEVVSGENEINFALDSSAKAPGGSGSPTRGGKYAPRSRSRR